MSLKHLLLTTLLFMFTASAEPFLEKQNIFTALEGDYRLYRIPGMVVTQKGTVLAYCEARKKPVKWAAADWAQIDILMRRSTDGGKTWDPPRKVVTPPADTRLNPVSTEKKLGVPGCITVNNFVAIADNKSDTLHFVYCVEYERCFYMRSEDDGLTFSTPVEITSAFEAFKSQYDWRVIAVGPGHGIHLTSGRLLATVWLSTGKFGNGHYPSIVTTIYSDDDGQTWHLGDIVADEGPSPKNPSETVVVELADGRVMMNLRNVGMDRKTRQWYRAVSISPDGASDWCTPYFDKTLSESVCMANILRYSLASEGDKNRILFSNPDNPGNKERKNLTIRMSYDEGKTWPVKRALEPGRSGYSDLARLPDGTILCFYERDTFDGDHLNTAHLCVARFNLEWLTQGQD